MVQSVDIISGKHQRPFYRWRFWFIGLIVIITSTIILRSNHSPSAQEQLAILDTKRAISDQENAALVYAKLLADFRSPFYQSDWVTDVDDSEKFEKLLGIDNWESQFGSWELGPYKELSHPWLEEDNADLTKLLRKHAESMKILMEASTFSECRFLLCSPTRSDYMQDLIIRSFNHYSMPLIFASYRDMGELRSDLALKKIQTVIQMGRHLQQHPTEDSFQYGVWIESWGLQPLNRILLTEEIRDLDLKYLWNLCGSVDNQWASISKQINQVMRLKEQYRRDETSIFQNLRDDWDRLRYYLSHGGKLRSIFNSSFKTPYTINSTNCLADYKELLFSRKCSRLLIELRRFKKQTGDWPERLEQINSEASKEFIQAMQGKKPLTLWFSDDCFVLYRPDVNSDIPNERDILVQDGRELSQSEERFIQAQLEYYLDLLMTVKWDISYQIEEYLTEMRRYAIPILVKQLTHKDSKARIKAIEILGEFASPNHYPRWRETSFLDDLIAGYHNETAIDVKHAYFNIFEYFEELSDQKKSLLDRTLLEIMKDDALFPLRCAAASTLIYLNRLAGFNYLGSDNRIFAFKEHYVEVRERCSTEVIKALINFICLEAGLDGSIVEALENDNAVTYNQDNSTSTHLDNRSSIWSCWYNVIDELNERSDLEWFRRQLKYHH